MKIFVLAEQKKVVDVRIVKMSEPLQVMRELAKCYRDASPKTCENSRVMACKAWVCLDQNGGHVQNFRFRCRGVAPGIDYLYEYTFTGVDL